ncbi:MAG: Short-chain dehydrogenase [Verrucomicrobia bacterium]|nr:Short-chain dehydrogenase [Verrucomicrobiota bacterium]
MTAPRVSDHYRTAFVTGASTGLGRAFAEMLLNDGVRVWGTARDTSRLAPLAGFPGFTGVALDLRDGDHAEAIFHRAEESASGFDLVVNNAGYGVFGEFTATDFAMWREQVEVMLINTARLSHAALRGFHSRAAGSRKGALVNISSLAAEFPLPFQSAYNVVKAGLSALNESLMIEVAGSGIVILDVRPGDYRTDFEASVRRPSAGAATLRVGRAWAAFDKMMKSGPEPDHAAASVRRALLKGRSGTVRTGRFFQAVVAPFLARFGTLNLRRRIQAGYFDVN